MDNYRDEIGILISKLSNKGKVLFAALTTERLYPNYKAFEKDNKWVDQIVLKNAISLIFQWLVNGKLYSDEEIKKMISSVDRITPDTEDFPGILTSFALDACTSTIDSLNFIIDNDDQYIINVATYARDTVDMFIQEKENMNSLDQTIDIQIENDDFMINEKKRQKQLIERLVNMNLNIVTNRMLDALRNDEPIIDLSLLR